MISLNPRLYTSLFRLVLLLYLLIISWLAFGTPPSGAAASVNDKVLHAGAFVVMAFLLEAALPLLSFWWLKVVLLLSYGLLIEVVQWQLPYREFSLLDLLADSAGVLIYWVLSVPIWKISDLFLSKAEA